MNWIKTSEQKPEESSGPLIGDHCNGFHICYYVSDEDTFYEWHNGYVMDTPKYWCEITEPTGE